MGIKEIYTELIMSHNRSKHNKGALEGADKSVRGHNPNCGDDITINVKVEDGIIKDATYEGSGCAISEASASIMIDLLKGSSVLEARKKIELFKNMIKGEVDEETAEEELLDASILSNIKLFPARVKCAVLAWYALDECIDK